MSDSHIISYFGSVIGFEMNTGEVLDIGAFTDRNRVDVAAQNAIRPNGRVIADFNAPFHHSGRMNKNMSPNLGPVDLSLLFFHPT